RTYTALCWQAREWGIGRSEQPVSEGHVHDRGQDHLDDQRDPHLGHDSAPTGSASLTSSTRSGTVMSLMAPSGSFLRRCRSFYTPDSTAATAGKPRNTRNPAIRATMGRLIRSVAAAASASASVSCLV